MASDAYQFPVAISRLSEGETSREPQNLRAIRWLISPVAPSSRSHSKISSMESA